MKKLLILIGCLVYGAAAGQAAPVWYGDIKGVPLGNVRTIHCLAADGCGNNPPIVTLLAQGATTATGTDCGNPVALSNVRNSDGTVSNRGVKAILPSPTDLTNAGFTSCDIPFIFGTPSDNFLCVDPNGGQLTGALNNFNITTEFCFPYYPAARLDLVWDGVSWKGTYTGSPAYMAEMPFGAGQMLKHGDVKLFLQSSSRCPQWTTGVAYAANACVYNSLKTYIASAAGTAGATPPTCTSGSCSDGTVTWYFEAASASCPQWVASTVYAAASCVYNNHVRYTSTAGGTSGVTAPTCVLGASTPTTCAADGTVTWTFLDNFYGGDLALCPWNGNGLITGGANSPTVTNYFADELLQKIPPTCIMFEPDLVAGSTSNYAEVVLNASDLTCSATISATCPAGIASGVIAGNPNGHGGNYIRFVSATNVNIGPQNQIKIFSGAMTGATVVPQAATVRLVHTAANNPSEPVPCATAEGTCLDLLNGVYNGNPILTPDVSTTFVPGDTATASYHYYYDRLNPNNIASGAHVTDLVTGQEADVNNYLATIVGAFKLNGTTPNTISDTESARNVASWFNRSPKKLRCAYAADQTEANTTAHETSSTIRCPFMVLGSPGTASGLGAFNPGVLFGYDGSASNGTANDGCQSAAAFVTGTTVGAPEPGASVLVNNANTNGAYFNAGFQGMKMSLTEGLWSITLLNQALTGGTCTYKAAGSSLFAYPWQ